MFRQAFRSLLKRPSHSFALDTVPRTLPRRPLSTAPPAQKSRSWKSSAVRWGLAIGGVYYYNRSIAFAEQLDHSIGVSTEPQQDDTKQPTIEALIENRQKRASSQAQAVDTDGQSSAPTIALQGDVGPREPETAQEYEDKASQEGAFNPETGEINWDCPCLGGMAHGPCGEEFKAAFSCFVYSTEEPKGMDCIDRFKGMQDCFRQHPEVYGSELDGDEDEDGIDEAIDEEEQKIHSSSPLESPPTSSEDYIAPRGSNPSAATEVPGVTDSSPKVESTQRNRNSS